MLERRVVAAALVCFLSAFPLFAAVDVVTEPVVADVQQRVAVLVELNEPAAAETYAVTLAAAVGKSPSTRPGRGDANKAARAAAVSAARQQIGRNVAAQARMRSALRSAAASAKPMFEVQRVANAIALEVAPDEIDNLRRTPGVRRVTIIEPEFVNTSTSVPHLGTAAVWGDAIGRGLAADGSGVTIGVIDTGIDYQHATFGGTGVLADYQANDRAVAPDAYYPTAKVVGGVDLAGDAYNGSAATISPDDDPMDCNGHGTHVASIAAGFGVNADGTTYAGAYDGSTPFSGMRIGPGTAPRAELYAIRVFGCGGSTNLTVQALEWASDPNQDADFSDHLDIVNMSLGSSFGRLSSSSAIAADNAAKVGVVVVVSAGNSGDTYFISGAPGSGKRVLTTAGTQDPGLPGTSVRVNTPAGIAGHYPAAGSTFGSSPSGPLTGDVVLALDASDAWGPLTTDGCSALTNAAAVAGKIALVDRGTCGFAVKVKNAQDAGAIAVLIANTAAGAFVTPGGSDPTVTIPSAMITFADGNTFKANLASLNATMFNGDGTIYSATSRGARGGLPIALKPDIAAPGQSITAAQTGVTCTGISPSAGCLLASGSGFIPGSQPLTISGTSMAAPHMAGIMALLRQLHPDWSVEELKAAAMNGAHHDITTQSDGQGDRYAPGRIGAGRTDAAISASTDVVAFDDEDVGVVSLSFDLDGVAVATSVVRTLRVVNRGTTDVTWDLATDIIADVPGISISFPGGSQVTVPAHGSSTVDVEVSADPTLMDHAREAAVSATQTAPASPASIAGLGAQPRHWVSEESGYITLSDGGTLKLRVPIYIAGPPASMMSAPDELVTGGAPTGSTLIPLSGVDVCTGTPAGASCTGSFPNDEVSLVTPFELQVASPLDPSVAPGFADLQYVGVAYTAATDQLLFGVSMWEPWTTPTDVAVNVYVDCGTYTMGANFTADTCNGVPDGNWDLIAFNTNPGSLSNLFGVNTPQQDVFLTAVFVRTRSSVVFGPVNYLNRASAAAIDTRVFNNQAMMLAVDRTRLKINAATGAFRYEVRTCPGSAPLCGALNGFWYDREAGPFNWNYLASNQGLDFGGINLAQDMNGASLPVTWNTANLTANASLGGLLLHHHNVRGQRAETFALSGAASADVGVGMNASPANPQFGDSVTLTFTASNAGPDASSAAVAITIPSGLTYVSDNGAGAFSGGLWTVGSLASGASATLEIVATLDTTDAVTVRAIASVTTPLDPNLANNEATVTLQAPRSADLRLTHVNNDPTVFAGGNVTYVITASNRGADSAYSVNLTEAFPSFPALNPSSHTASQGDYDPATGAWNIGALANGASSTLTITTTAPNMAGLLLNNMALAGATSDPDSTNNATTASTLVISPATITPSLGVSTLARPGDAVTYTVTLSNTAAYDQQDNPGNEFAMSLPAGIVFSSAGASGGTPLFAGGIVTWSGSVAAGGSVTITINGTIDVAAVPGTTISATGTASFDADGDGTNEAVADTNTSSFVVLSPATLVATKSVSGSPIAGGPVTYTIVVENTSDWAQLDNAGAELTDVLPATLTLVSASSTSGTAVATIATNTVTWNGSLAPHATVTISIDATINGSTTVGTSITNTAATSYDADGDGTNEASGSSNDATVTVVSPAVLSATKGVATTGRPGDAVTYMITLGNTGAATQLDNPGDELTDVLPAEVRLVSASATSGTAVANLATNTVTWNGSLIRGTGVNLTISATVDDAAPLGLVDNQAQLSYDADGDGTNEASASSSIASFMVTSPASLASPTMTVSGSRIAGATMTYTLTVTNGGPSTQLDNPGDEIEVPLPASLTLASVSASTGTAVNDAGTLRWNGSLAPSESVVITFTATLDAAAAGGDVVTATATVRYDADGNATNETTTTAQASFTVLSPASLAAPVKMVSGLTYPGATVTYTIVLTNSGVATQLDNPGDELTDVLPAEVTAASASATGGTAALAGNTVTWNGAIAAGETVTITITATVDPVAAGVIVSNQATVRYDSDGDQLNDAVSLTDDPSTVAANDVTSFVVTSPSTIAAPTKSVVTTGQPGATVTYTIVLPNSGPAAQLDNPGDELVDVLPSSLSLVSATATGGTALANLATNTVTWNGSIAASSSVTVTVTATIDAAAGTTVSNQATVHYDADGDGSNETSSLTNDPSTAAAGDATSFAVTSPATLAAPSKSVTGSGEPGSTVTYAIVLSNSGAAAQLDNPGDELVDVLPASLTLVSATATGGTAVASVATNTVTWNGSIAPSSSVTITIEATVDADNPLGTTIANQATVNYDGDGNGTNESSSVTNDPSTGATGDATAFVVASPAMVSAATKTMSGGTLPGDTVTYTITFTNDGSSTQFDNPGDEVVDVLSAELEPLSVSASTGTAVIDGDTIRWNGSVAVGETVAITIEARIAASTLPGTVISNQAIVSYDADGNGTNESTVLTNVTTFTAGAASLAAVPALSPAGLMMLAALMAFAALVALKK